MAQGMILGNRAKAVCVCAMLLCAVASPGSADTVVRFQTVLGDFDVQLYDTATPITVANFLNYVNSGRYENSFFHRMVPGFVLQGGGFTFDETADPQIAPVESFGMIQNEFDPSRSNLRGTMAMAKQSGNVNSATSQFFINLGDNSFLDTEEYGFFTVFAEVIGDGMEVVDLLASQQVWNMSTFHPAFGELPLVNYSGSGPWTPMLEMFDVGFLPGDVDGNGSVDNDDLNSIRTNWGQSGLGRTDGDLNGNGVVDGLDYTEVISYWTTGTLPPEPGAMPEPATLALLLIGGLALLRRRPEA